MKYYVDFTLSLYSSEICITIITKKILLLFCSYKDYDVQHFSACLHSSTEIIHLHEIICQNHTEKETVQMVSSEKQLKGQWSMHRNDRQY
jgi:hypothetical protein